MPTKIIGNQPYQVPRNADLGGLAYQNPDNVSVDNIKVDGVLTGNLDAQVAVSGNVRPSSRPSLLLDFAKTKTVDPRVSFTRSTTGVYYDGSTVAKTDENLATYSTTLSSVAWGISLPSIVSTTANDTVAPDGTNTAIRINLTNPNQSAQCGLYRISRIPCTTGFSQSVYAKAGSLGYLGISQEGSNSGWAIFDLLAGKVSYSSGCTAKIVFAGNGWYRCILENIQYASANGSYFLISAKASAYNEEPWGGGNSVISAGYLHVWGPQHEQKTYVTPYVPTTITTITNYAPSLQTSAINTPRFDHDPITGESKGLLTEEGRTNLLQYSQQFEAWTRPSSSVTVQSNACTAPDGTQTGCLVTNGTADTSIYYGTSASAATAYTISAYIKMGNGPGTTLRFRESSDNHHIDVEMSTWSVTGTASVTSYSITAVGNGWYRCAMTFTTTGTSLSFNPRITNNSGSFYIWGAQIEAGTFVSSYIPTPLTYKGRNSPATYTGTNGTIQIAAISSPRYELNVYGGNNLILETSSTNAFNKTERFSAMSLTATIVARNAALAPDGLMTAEKLIENATTAWHGVTQTYTASISTNYVYSVYAKAGEKTRIGIVMEDSSGVGAASFDLSNGTVINNLIGGSTDLKAQSSITAIGNGWYRISTYRTATNTSANCQLRLLSATTDNYAGNGLDGVYLWGAQLESGTVATSYIPSAETFTGRTSIGTYYDLNGTLRFAPSGVARYSYNPSILTSPPKMLIEDAATNVLLYSEQLDNAAGWSAPAAPVAAVVTANAAGAPDGTTTADLVSFSGSTTHPVYQQTNTYPASGATITGSMYIKRVSGTSFALQVSLFNAGGVIQDGYANITFSGTSLASIIPSNTYMSVSAQNLGNGWYRVSATNLNTGLTPTYTRISIGQVGGAGSLYVWGAQLELGPVATSYIQTTSAQVTRAADTVTSTAQTRAADIYGSSQVTRSGDFASITGTNFSSWYKTDEGTVYTETQTDSVSTNSFALQISDNSYSNRIVVCQDSAYSIGQVIVNSTPTLQPTNNPVRSSALRKQAFAYKANDSQLTTDGVSGTADTSGQLPQGLTRLDLGSDHAGYNRLSGTIKRVVYYPKRLTNAELQSLTA